MIARWHHNSAMRVVMPKENDENSDNRAQDTDTAPASKDERADGGGCSSPSLLAMLRGVKEKEWGSR